VVRRGEGMGLGKEREERRGNEGEGGRRREKDGERGRREEREGGGRRDSGMDARRMRGAIGARGLERREE
jgi:hypothetical protein